MLLEDFTAPLADFGVSATLDGRSVTVIFDRAAVAALGAITTGPQAGLPTADAGAATRGSTLDIGADTYRVVSALPDGTGWTTLELEIA